MFRKCLFLTSFVIISTQSAFGAMQQQPKIYAEQIYEAFNLFGQDRSCDGLAKKLCTLTRMNTIPPMIIVFEGYSKYLLEGWRLISQPTSKNLLCNYISYLESSLNALCKVMSTESLNMLFIERLQTLVEILRQNRPHEIGSQICLLHNELEKSQTEFETTIEEKYPLEFNYAKQFFDMLASCAQDTSLTEITNKICLYTGHDPMIFNQIFYGFLGNLHWRINMVDFYANKKNLSSKKTADFQNNSFCADAGLNALADLLIIPNEEPAKTLMLALRGEIRSLAFKITQQTTFS